MAALTARGLAVSPHKVGPDYIDPGTTRWPRDGRGATSTRTCAVRSWSVPARARVARVRHRGRRGRDGAVRRGRGGRGAGVHGAGGEAAAGAGGAGRGRVVAVAVGGGAGARLRDVGSGGTGRGVILNKVASDRHEALLREALDSVGVPVLGVLRRAAQVETPSRHLGLVPVAERGPRRSGRSRRWPRRWRRGAISRRWSGWRGCGCVAVCRVGCGRGLGFLDPGGCTGDPLIRVAVAGGAAFTFSYAEHSELLAAAGAEVVVFDPLRDEELPDGTGGLVIGGGFPEVYAAELSANEALRKAVAELALSGAPVAAECAGLLYLCRELDGLPMCGVLDASARMSERLALGYRDAVAVSDSALAGAGTRMRGHEFHRTVVEPGAGTRRVGCAVP
ncbi:cobyrinate a,c-diamide synthase [Streptomyces sp. INA 01156]